MAYYNENDPYAAQWLRNLVDKGLLPRGDVDERSIVEVQPDDLWGYNQCHFFAGIGGWAYALNLAGWGERPVWTGSCPCQPFSAAGQRKGFEDDRHLWPDFYRLIAKCFPATVFGEQVASKDGLGWLDRVRADLEDSQYAFGAADLCAAGVGAPHIRQRLYWVANTQQGRGRGESTNSFGSKGTAQSGRQEDPGAVEIRNGGSTNKGLAHTDIASYYERSSGGKQSLRDGVCEGGEGVGNPAAKRLQEQRSEYSPSGERCSGLLGFAVQAGVPQWNGPTVALECQDGYRRASSQPNAFPVAHGVPARMGKLRGSGNAIVPQVAQAFIEAFMEVRP